VFYIKFKLINKLLFVRYVHTYKK